MGVTATTEADAAQASVLARRLSLPLLEGVSASSRGAAEQAVLQVDRGIPQVQMLGRNVPGPVTVDFADKALASRRRAGHNEMLGKAVGWKQARAPAVLDATGGFGRDAFLLADLGCEMQVCEREPVMAALFEDALSRAVASGDPWLVEVCGRMRLHAFPAESMARAALASVNVIYLDPMFPLDRRAAPAKEMQVLHRLVADSAGEDSGAQLLAWALEQQISRVVVKRPRRAPPLDGPAPGHTLSGRSVRFDVYPVA